MTGENINNPKHALTVLVAPLDWGLGHATRCIPIINHLLSNGATVLLAADGACRHLLSAEFPHLKILHLTGYQVTYQTGRSGFSRRLLMQIPRIFRAIRFENAWLKRMIARENIDVVISDNRYGLYNSNAHTIIITHQLRLQSGIKLLDDILQGMHYRYLKRFNECWVPDEKNGPGLGHELSHPRTMPEMAVHYLGLLSRFSRVRETPPKFNWLLLLSGPEPQRTMLENMLLENRSTFSGNIALVRGLPQGGDKLNSFPNWSIFDHLSAAALNQLVQSSNNVLCRSGYTSLMDLRLLGKKALIIPTPGQWEQEYLARKNTGWNGFLCFSQYSGGLTKHVLEVERMDDPPAAETGLQNFINQWVIDFYDRRREK